ncbi:hypothetical protein HAX54_043962, partial [Datura stramonium]|nr:hypothetical protein [Datura stramonium]
MTSERTPRPRTTKQSDLTDKGKGRKKGSLRLKQSLVLTQNWKKPFARKREIRRERLSFTAKE